MFYSVFGIINSYVNLNKMGVDCWLVMVGVVGKIELFFVVIDVGIVIMVDFVVGG